MDSQAKALSGLYLVDKPVGCTSMDVVRRVRRAAGGVKTGHAGTLDPLASGLLICCCGRATRAVSALMDMTKVYRASIDLSAFTATDDAEAPRQPVDVADRPDEEQVRQVLRQFIGEIQQRPPAYSAVQVNGQRAYKLARRGKAPSLPPRPVRIDAIEPVAYQWPRLDLVVTCGKGTYIRALARQIGTALGTGGYLIGLRRTAIGPYSVEQATPLDKVPARLLAGDLLTGPAIRR